MLENAATVPVADLLRLADRIEGEHADGRFCACCSTDANHLRDLARRYGGRPIEGALPTDRGTR